MDSNRDDHFWQEVEEDTRTDEERNDDSLFAMIEPLMQMIEESRTVRRTAVRRRRRHEDRTL